MSGIPGRRLTLGRDRQRLRGMRRRARALQVWEARFEGFFPPVTRNGSGDKNWYARLPVAQRLVSGPRASRRFQRACLAAMLEVVAHLRRAKPTGAREIRVVALVPLNDLFAASIDVFWGDEDFFRFFARSGPYQDWALIGNPRQGCA